MRTITITVSDDYERAKANFLNYLDDIAGKPSKPYNPDDLEFIFGRLVDCPDPLPDEQCHGLAIEVGSTYGDAVDELLRLQEKSRDY